MNFKIHKCDHEEDNDKAVGNQNGARNDCIVGDGDGVDDDDDDDDDDGITF